VAVHASPHEVHQAKNQLAIVVLEAAEALAVLYGSYNWSQETLAHGNHMTVMFLDDFQPQIAQQFSEFFAAKLQTADTSIELFSLFSKFFDKNNPKVCAK
jgi:hypothetical protein